MKFVDAMALDEGSLRLTSAGYAVLVARVARADNVQLYLGDEVGRPDLPVVRVFRPSKEVFHKDSIKSYAGVPITMGHPKGGVTSANWADLAKGEVGDEVLRDGEFVQVPMMLRDKKTVSAIQSEARELSMGYDAELIFEDGISPSGEPYDAYMADLKMNHVAIVDRARGGSDLRIGDAKDWGAAPVTQDQLALVDRARGGDQRIGDDNPNHRNTPMTTKTVLVDGLSVETTDAGAQAIAKLLQDRAEGRTAATAAATAHQTAIAAKDAELAKKDGEIDGLKAKVLTDAQIDARVQARADLITTAKAIHDADYSGKSDDEIRKAVVLAKVTDVAMKDKPQAYIDARFDILAEDAKKDPVKAVLLGKQPQQINDNGYAESVRALNEGPNYKPNEGGVH